MSRVSRVPSADACNFSVSVFWWQQQQLLLTSHRPQTTDTDRLQLGLGLGAGCAFALDYLLYSLFLYLMPLRLGPLNNL
jgi:hypothetical protein